MLKFVYIAASITATALLIAAFVMAVQAEKYAVIDIITMCFTIAFFAKFVKGIDDANNETAGTQEKEDGTHNG
jgi:NADH:ubiquinone oxidoreductase subunit 6 (subunit J)